MNNQKYGQYLILIIFLAFLIRLLGINQQINEDELHWQYSAAEKDWFGTIMRNSPLSIYALNTLTTLIGTEIWAIRLTFIIAGTK